LSETYTARVNRLVTATATGASVSSRLSPTSWNQKYASMLAIFAKGDDAENRSSSG
jgi:hypothetical protein